MGGQTRCRCWPLSNLCFGNSNFDWRQIHLASPFAFSSLADCESTPEKILAWLEVPHTPSHCQKRTVLRRNAYRLHINAKS